MTCACSARFGHFSHCPAAAETERQKKEAARRRAWGAWCDAFGACWCGSGKEGTATWANAHVDCAPPKPTRATAKLTEGLIDYLNDAIFEAQKRGRVSGEPLAQWIASLPDGART